MGNIKKQKYSVWKLLLLLILWMLFIYYIKKVLDLTLLERIVSFRRSKLEPFWELRQILSGPHRRYWAKQIGGNLVMLYPLGIFLPILIPWMRKGPFVVMAGFLFSCAIELVQYYTARGFLETDDVIHNTIGAWAGYLTFSIGYRLFQRLRKRP